MVRTKLCGLTASSVQTAIGALEDRDYEVHLFREQSTGQDAIVRRKGLGSYEVVLLRTSGRPVSPATDRTTIATHVPVRWTAAEA